MLRAQLEKEPQVLVVGEAHDLRGTDALVRRVRPDILLIECVLNREFSRKKRASAAATTVVVLVETAEIEEIVEAFELGAKGVLLKASLPQEWRRPLQSVLSGQYWVENASVALLLQAARDSLAKSTIRELSDFGLTAREVEIAEKIAGGRSNRQVGMEFSICERTVKHHLTNIFKKVGVSSRLELAVLVRDKIPLQPIAPEMLSSRRPSENRVDSPTGRELVLATEP